ncbi:RNA 3'-terminal phosphate cyclase [Spea bombifrons]|uniref:RNA 3'-terminal phosphate cyclase n=1 Tax=Spea bombifrons TaxID=233779 RepID=UPI00234A1315|nr:RNA 3'-terminal phosphate cyclase [Spea bombifrons]XP_053324899.1 RNA 3'-terminal phosphate cyclase [Spea bombifrons]XP_053324900.1 RNA 3'-terminal phosphate cyclase [Spea bombifrons]
MAEEGDTVEIDGGIMEGGGQILRICTALSCLLGKRIHIGSIRAGRSTPGLRPQHLSGLETVRDLCAGQLENAAIGSTDITFTPGKLKGGALTADTKTAGSVCLLLQVSLPCALYAESPSELVLKGGTNAEMAPQIDYTTMVFKPIAEHFSFKLDCDIRRRGYYPRGGGEILVRVSPIRGLSPINLTDRGTITKIYGRAFVAGVLPYKVVKDMISAAVRCIRKELRDLYVNIQGVQEPSEKAVGNGSGIIIVAETSTGCLFAGSALGKRGVTADRVGAEAADILLRNLRHGGCVDEYLQDQLIIFMALADGVSLLRTGPVTLHTQTAIHFAETLTKARFNVKKCEDSDSDSYIIECRGIGLQNKNM